MAQAAPCIPHSTAKWRRPTGGSPPSLHNGHDAHDDAGADVFFEQDALDDIHSSSRANSHCKKHLRVHCSRDPPIWARQATQRAQRRSRWPLSRTQLPMAAAHRCLHHAGARSCALISHPGHRNVDLRCERVWVHAVAKNRYSPHTLQTRSEYSWSHNLTHVGTQAEARAGYRDGPSRQCRRSHR